MDREMIRNEISSQGFKQIWIAMQIEVHPTTLSRFLAGKTTLRENALKKLLDILGLKTETIKAS